MHILLVNNYYYHRGGDCTYLFSLKKILEAKGHKVSILAMHHPENYDSECSKYFVSYINYDEEVKSINLSSGIKVLKRTIYSSESKIQIERLIQAERPDIVHVQNVHHHITPSIFYVIKKHNIPIVWTLHDYTILCPNTSFLSHGRICEKCKKNRFFWPAFERCKKNSLGASTMAGLEALLHGIMKLQEMVDVFIAPSKFLRDKFIEYGFSEDKVVRLDLFTDIEEYVSTVESVNAEEREDYYLFVGRISAEKGIVTLIDAAIRIGTCKVKIVGTGPLLEDMIEYGRSRDKENIVEFMGYKHRNELVPLYRNAKFVVVPSEWYETAGLIIFEAFAFAKPVIGARIGGITELVRDTERGLLFEAGDTDDLTVTIRYMLDNPELAVEMGETARTYVRENHSPAIHYQQLMQIYNVLLSNIR